MKLTDDNEASITRGASPIRRDVLLHSIAALVSFRVRHHRFHLCERRNARELRRKFQRILSERQPEAKAGGGVGVHSASDHMGATLSPHCIQFRSSRRGKSER